MPDGAGLAPTRRTGLGPVATLPNLISFARLCAVPLATALVLRAAWAPALLVFALAALSDTLDGWLARRTHPTRLGAVLDPLADKALLTTLSVSLAFQGLLPAWYAILALFRDLVIVGGVVIILALGERVVMRPVPSSRLNTVLQGLLIAAALACACLHHPTLPLLLPLAALTTLTTLVSGAAYVRAGARLHGV